MLLRLNNINKKYIRNITKNIYVTSEIFYLYSNVMIYNNSNSKIMSNDVLIIS